MENINEITNLLSLFLLILQMIILWRNLNLDCCDPLKKNLSKVRIRDAVLNY